MRFSDTSANLRPSRGRRLGWWTKVVNGLAPHHISGTFRRELRKDPRLPIVLWFQRPPRVGFQSAHRKQVETANLFGDHWIWLVYFWIIDGWDQPWKKTLKNKSQLVNQKIESSYWIWCDLQQRHYHHEPTRTSTTCPARKTPKFKTTTLTWKGKPASRKHVFSSWYLKWS